MKIIEVKVKSGNNKPYSLNGIAYKRVDSETPLIPPDELEIFILTKHEQEFDNQICDGAVYEDIDLETINWFKIKYKEVSGK